LVVAAVRVFRAATAAIFSAGPATAGPDATDRSVPHLDAVPRGRVACVTLVAVAVGAKIVAIAGLGVLQLTRWTRCRALTITGVVAEGLPGRTLAAVALLLATNEILATGHAIVLTFTEVALAGLRIGRVAARTERHTASLATGVAIWALHRHAAAAGTGLADATRRFAVATMFVIGRQVDALFTALRQVVRALACAINAGDTFLAGMATGATILWIAFSVDAVLIATGIATKTAGCVVQTVVALLLKGSVASQHAGEIFLMVIPMSTAEVAAIALADLPQTKGRFDTLLSIADLSLSAETAKAARLVRWPLRRGRLHRPPHQGGGNTADEPF
jgi:hypothetical protein